MRSHKLFLSALLVLVLAFTSILFVAHAQDSSGAGLTIGFAQTGSESGWRTDFTNAMMSEAEAMGINLLFSDGQQKQENQIAALRSFIAQGVDAIILAPIVETGWDDVLQEAADAEIPVLIIDRGVTADPSLYITRVASDFVYEGRLAGAWLATATADRASCNVVELYGTVGSSPAIDRATGFADAIALFPQIQIIASQSGDFTRSGGKTVMESFLSSMDPSTICAVFAHNDDMLIGAIQAMEEAGITPAVDILTVSVDATNDELQMLIDGKANATVLLSPYMGGPAYQAIIDYLGGAELPPLIMVPSAMYFQDTAAAELANRTGG
ncbi:MAG: ABC transporter substrate-binding protein [Anaerolineae bacterium]|nr:ABC transporter substrate-binding protein [Anaerolineae bacterium]